MNRKVVGIIIIVAGGVILAGIIYFVFFMDYSLNDVFRKIEDREIFDDKNSGPSPAAIDASAENKNVQRIVLDAGELENMPVPPSQKRDDAQIRKDDLKRMAASFAERFGSYSNQSNFNNITDLKIFMSRRMQAWADDYINQRREQKSAGDLYYGITTKSVAQEIKEIDDDAGNAVLLVQTRRREASGSTLNTSNVFDQNIAVNLIKEGGAWKVDSAAWQ